MRPDDGQGSPFHRLRGIFMEILNLAPGISDKRRRIGMTLAFRTHESTFARTGELVSWIGATTLAIALGYDRRTVQRGLKKLLEEGVIEVEKKGGGRARSTHYRFSKRWLQAALERIENCGIAEAYGLPDDLFAHAYGGTMAAQIARYSGAAPAHSAEKGGDEARNSGMDTAVSGQNSGAPGAFRGMSGMDAAVSGRNSGAFSGGGQETATNCAVKGGSFAGNSGKAVPPETDLNYRNKSSAPEKRAAASPQGGQYFLNHVIPGGKSTAGGDVGYPGSGEEERRLVRLTNRVGKMLGDQNRAALAVEWMEEAQIQRVCDGFLPSDADLERWVDWALERAEGEGITTAATLPQPAGLPPDLALAMQSLARQAVLDVLPTIIQTIQQQLRPGGAAADSAAA